MTLAELKSALAQSSDKNLRIVLPDGDPIPADFHITEVGHVTKKFVDCGGTRRASESCVLQAWVARNDPDHRLTAGKLGGILEMAGSLIPSESLQVEIEYEGCVISQYPLAAAEIQDGALSLLLTEKHTDCLDKEACGLESCGSDGDGGKCC
jgi:hypothetical protein